VYHYKNNVEVCLGKELVQIAALSFMYKDEEDAYVGIRREHYLYYLLISKSLQSTFANVEIVLSMYLVLMGSN